MNIPIFGKMAIVAYLYTPGTYIFGWITLFICSLVLHLLIRKPILYWLDKRKGKEGRSSHDE